MKNLYVFTGLTFALICVSQIWAQESAPVDDEPAQAQVSERVDAKKDDKASYKVEYIDDEQPDEALKRLSDVVRKVAGDEVADEVVVELEGLSEERKRELAESLKDGHISFNSDDVPDWVGAVAIIGVIGFLALPLLLIVWPLVHLGRKRRDKMKLIQVYVDSGRDVPVELLRTLDGASSFRSGIMLTGTGLGIIAAFSMANENSVAALGLIPFFIGVAKLIYWLVEERKQIKA